MAYKLIKRRASDRLPIKATSSRSSQKTKQKCLVSTSSSPPPAAPPPPHTTQLVLRRSGLSGDAPLANKGDQRERSAGWLGQPTRWMRHQGRARMSWIHCGRGTGEPNLAPRGVEEGAAVEMIWQRAPCTCALAGRMAAEVRPLDFHSHRLSSSSPPVCSNRLSSCYSQAKGGWRHER